MYETFLENLMSGIDLECLECAQCSCAPMVGIALRTLWKMFYPGNLEENNLLHNIQYFPSL